MYQRFIRKFVFIGYLVVTLIPTINFSMIGFRKAEKTEVNHAIFIGF